MMKALKSSGCTIDIRRHFSCEVCDYSVSGGYDPELNQIVVCQNVSTRKGMVQGVLVHEMIHMFDYCRNELDFKNMEHLACSEIRAANLTHCSFTSACRNTTMLAGETPEHSSRATLADPSPTKLPKCDRTFVSRGGASNGTFHAPELINPNNHSRQCLYTFLAAPGQRALIELRTFDLRGKPPDGAAAGELVNSAFGGRYCGPIPPRRRVSLHRAVALSFYTDKPYTPPTLFTGSYQFINASEFEIGTPIPNTLCSFVIDASKRKTGLLLSPTYPGVYPKELNCNYQFRNLVLYSSDERLLVTFYSLPRAANTQNRGFKGIFEFSESFVKLDFISKHDAEHIRGSECDQKILSKKESSGFVYFIYGMQDSQNLERVRLEFQNFSIPKSDKPKPDSACSDGYLKVYLRGQEATDSYDKHDAELCGEGASSPPFPAPLMSDGPRLVMYRVPGTAAPGGECAFTYRSEARKRGEFNSPRYPSNYPSRTNCTYTLDATPNEQVTVVFDHFKDWVEAWWNTREGSWVPLGRWCGLATPGPLQSPRGTLGLRIALHTDSDHVASGFKARYVFEPAKSIFGDCGGNVSGLEWGVITSPRFPLPYEPPARGAASRVCNWFVTARPGKRLLLNFEHFAVEGHLTERGCPAAVLRLWYESPGPPLELCGEKAPADRWQFIIADKSVGAAGWRAVWTEVTVPEGGVCPRAGGWDAACAGACLPPAAACSRLPHCATNDPERPAHC
ncbi:hypothetical protein MSG28_007909 [Choristoneura fumiferana]|uniref:Uncharacterized protein n=1 Tax=Choristoneura fumiferana TaxID=7141 RepID=A0ACC0J9A3_CHOFU|nr:hypothetical protein MSG28_007909 [Choristoneura fumiferana]